MFGVQWKDNGLTKTKWFNTLHDADEFISHVFTYVRKCLECNKTFSITGSSRRKDRTYCSAACKIKGYRRRKKTEHDIASDPVTTKEPRPLARVPEVAFALHVSRSTLYLWMNQGLLPYMKIGKCRRLRWEDVDAFVASASQFTKPIPNTTEDTE